VFARHDLELDIVYTRGSKMVIESLLSGDCDLGVLSADDVVYEVETNAADLFIFMGLHGGILQLIARPGLTAARLKGTRLGVDDPHSGFALVAHRILGRFGLKRSDYETLAIGGHEPRAKALAEGTIDVTLSTPPFSLELVARGFSLLARAHDYMPRYQASCGVATRRWAANNRESLQAYIRAYRESLGRTLDPSNRGALIDELASEFALKPELAAATFEALANKDDGLFPDAHIDRPGIEAVLALRLEAGLLKPPAPDPAKYCDLPGEKATG
jgi:ABC-type nitrate/sulfonate/bicarbonate transport system substrate-binding protein